MGLPLGMAFTFYACVEKELKLKIRKFWVKLTGEKPVAPSSTYREELMKNVLVQLVKSVLIPLRITVAASAANVGVHLKTYCVRADYINNFKQRNGWYHENS